MEILNKIKQLLANDSARVKDVNGYLSVADCNISKAAVNPYYGRDIPKWQELNLDPNRIYMLLRDPNELEKSADSFNGKPLLRGHHDIHSGDIPKEKVIGSIGTDAHYSNPFLVASVTVWDESDINLIEADKVKELSSCYFYRADMTAGEFNGVQYDGVMRDIVGNHVAVVERGRAGSQVAVADSDFNITKQELNNMKLEDFKKLFGAILAKDAKDEDIEEALKKADDETDEKEDSKATDEEESKKADDEKEDDKKADDESEKDEDKAKDSFLTAKDAALLEQSIEKRLAEKFRQANLAQAAVRPFIGELAMDSAEDIYAKGLKHFNVDLTGVAKDSYKALFEAVSKANKLKANDSAPKSTGFLDSLPNRKTL